MCVLFVPCFGPPYVARVGGLTVLLGTGLETGNWGTTNTAAANSATTSAATRQTGNLRASLPSDLLKRGGTVPSDLLKRGGTGVGAALRATAGSRGDKQRAQPRGAYSTVSAPSIQSPRQVERACYLQSTVLRFLKPHYLICKHHTEVP